MASGVPVGHIQGPIHESEVSERGAGLLHFPRAVNEMPPEEIFKCND